jgi:hypothetical protein
MILCDRHASGLNIVDGAATLVDSIGSSFRTRVIAVDANHPFGPTVLEAPTHLRTPGLRLATGQLQLDAAVQVLVAAGGATGISAGTVTNPGASISIIEVGAVGDLVELDCLVAPGASGAPVVDATLSVCGFIVASSGDQKDPRSFAYPAEQWASFVRHSDPGTPVKLWTDEHPE